MEHCKNCGKIIFDSATRQKHIQANENYKGLCMSCINKIGKLKIARGCYKSMLKCLEEQEKVNNEKHD